MKKMSMSMVMVFTLSLVMGFALPLRADVTVVRATKFGGFGGMGASKSQEKESIQGVKKRVESVTSFTGSFLSKVTGEKKMVNIIRVDKDLIWDIDVKGKSYTENPISLPKSEKSDASMRNNKGEGRDGEAEEEPEVRIVKNEFKVKKTGKKKKINGFSCEEYVMTWLMVTENVKTKERNKNLMTTVLWNTPETSKTKVLAKEEKNFTLAYLKKLGLDMSPGEMRSFGLSFLGNMATKSGAELKKEMSKVKGYSIATSVKWEGEPGKEEGKSKDAGDDEEKSIDVSKGVGGMFSGLMKSVVKKKSKPEKEGEMKVVFESYTEIKSIDTSSLSKSLFQVPAGYKKKGN